MEGVSNKHYQYNYSNYYTQSQYNRPRSAQYRKQEDGVSGTTKLVASAGILQGIAIFLQLASEWCGKKLMQGKEFTNSENIKNIAKQMLKDSKLDDKIAVEFITPSNAAAVARRHNKPGIDIIKELEPVAKGENAFYLDSLKLAVAPEKKPSLVLHELGHAITAHKGKLLKFMQKSRMFAASVPTALVLLNSATPKKPGEKTFLEKHAFLLGFLGFLPTILEEGLASLRGIKAASKFKKAGKLALDLKPLKRNYGFAWLTYVIAGLGLGVAAKQSILDSRNS